MDIKMEIEDEPMSASGTLTKVKCEDEKVLGHTVFVSTGFVNVSADCIQIDSNTKIKNEPLIEIKDEMELPVAADSDLQNEESSSRTEVAETLGEEAAASGSKFQSPCSLNEEDLSAVISRKFNRLITQSLSGYTISSSCYLKRKNSAECSSGNSKPSHFLKSSQPQEQPQTNCILNSHVKGRNLTQNIKKTHKCEVCGKSFRYLSVLKKHSVGHEDEKPFKCDICEKSYGLASTLKRHKLSHDDIRSFTCEICDKSFVLSSTLKEHKLTHESRKPLACEICDKSFTQESHLIQHKLIHEG